MSKPVVLSLSELKKLRGQQKKPLIVYLDEKQLMRLVSGSKAAKGNPNPRGVTITLAKLPATPGGFVEISAPGGKGPYIDAKGAIRAQRVSEDGCTAVLSGGIIVCSGSCGTGTACGLAFAPFPVALFRTSARMGGLSTTVQSGGCGCR